MKIGTWLQSIAQKALNPPVKVAAERGKSAWAHQVLVTQGLIQQLAGRCWTDTSSGFGGGEPVYQPASLERAPVDATLFRVLKALARAPVDYTAHPYIAPAVGAAWSGVEAAMHPDERRAVMRTAWKYREYLPSDIATIAALNGGIEVEP